MTIPENEVADLLVVGHLTRDLVAGDERLGGAASYAALAAAERGARVELVTAAPPEWPLAAPLLQHPRIRAVVLPTSEPTTFELVYAQGERTVYRRSVAPPIGPIRTRCPLVYLAPVAGELGADAATGCGEALVVAGLQGWMRTVADDGRVTAVDPPIIPGLHAVVFSEHDHPHADALATALARTVPVVVVTRGARGATLLEGGRMHAVAAVPAVEVDPTGAGDVFGIVLALALRAGREPRAAAAEAAFAAARSVERVGPSMAAP